MSEPFIGEIRMAGFNFAPKGFALCNGQILAIAQNQALFAILGTTYGGNGTTTFALPNLQGRVPMHFGTGVAGGNATLGQAAGEANHTLIMPEMPTHTHGLRGATAPVASSRSMDGTLYGVAQTTGTINTYNPAIAGPMAAGVVGQAGGSQPHNNMQPYLVVTFYIALQGIFPSRN